MAFSLLVDASELKLRLEDKNRGEVMPIDPVAGHIPGALSVRCEENVTPEGRFHSPNMLRRRFENFVISVSPENVICYCGSVVTAAHNILAIAHAGLGRA
jgi:thiosulfate/3-mercaptopyruvate sulfurtransferase